MKIKNFIPKDILIIFSLTVILIIARVIIFGSHSFDWLVWNIFLATIPFLISSVLLWLFEKRRLKNFFLIIGGIAWLLFIPNAPYIVTDLIHIGVVRSVPVIYDSFLLFSSAWLGIYLWLYSTSQIEEIIKTKYKKITAEVFMFVIILLTSFGIYLGRFLRLNSWDIFSDSAYFLKILHQKLLIVNNSNAYLYVVLFTVFMYLFYRAFKYRK